MIKDAHASAGCRLGVSIGAVLLAGSFAGCDGPRLATPPAFAPGSVTAVATGELDCDRDPANGAEVDGTSDPHHCGACEVSCGAGDRCVAGSCRRARKIVMIDESACAVVPRGVMCWGGNVYQPPGAPRPPYPRPVLVAGMEGALSLSIGRSGLCAILPGKRAACWRNGTLERPPSEDTVADLTVRDSDVAILRKTGHLEIWEGAGATPAPAANVEAVTSLASGSDQACALGRDGRVRCWAQPAARTSLENRQWEGYLTGAFVGQLRERLDMGVTRQAPAVPVAPSTPPASPIAPGTATPVMPADRGSAATPVELGGSAATPVEVGDLSNVVQLAGNGGPLCALSADDRAVCWGLAGSAQGVSKIGDAVVLHERYAARAVEIAAGSGDLCAALASGKVACWGERSAWFRAGILKSGIVWGIDDAVAVAAGADTSCALRASGKVSCWGQNQRGQLGNGTLSRLPRPVQVPGLSGIRDLALEGASTCVLDSAGVTSCWGSWGAYDGTYDGMPERASTPQRIATTGKRILALPWEICTVGEKGDAICYAVGARDLIPPRKDVRDMVVGAVLSTSGQLWRVWWSDIQESKPTPHVDKVPGYADVAAIAGSGLFVCAVRRSGQVSCYEREAPSFLGQTTAARVENIEVRAPADDVSAAALRGGTKLYLLRRDGTVAFADLSPRLLEQREASRSAPPPPPLAATPVPGLAGVIQLAAGDDHVCALRGDGAVLCWGMAFFGQLGHGDYRPHEEPEPVVGLSGVVRIAAGQDHTCAVTKGGEVFCWGRNEEDQAGQEAPSFALSPSDVLEPL